MAERIVTSLLPQLGSLALGEANFLRGVHKEIMYLHDELEWINSFLRDADQKCRRYKSVKVWVSQIKNLAYDVEDIIDLFTFKAEQEREKNFVLRFMGYPKYLFTLHKLGNQIEVINKRIKNISANKKKYGIETLEAEETSSRLIDGLAQKERRDPMEQDEDQVVGFKEDMEKIAMLLKQKERQQLLVVTIVGMGGSGKSTLAKTVCNRKDVKGIFDSYAFIYVSQEYCITDLLCSAITQVTNVTKRDIEFKEDGKLRNMLSESLKERRCLFVFDDVWRKEDWDILKNAFLHQANDQQNPKTVLITTRHMDVAQHADPSTKPHVHRLHPLGHDESFCLFTQKVFQFQEGSEARSYPKGMEELGESLVATCGGLPLAIVVLGGLLSKKEKTPKMWEKVLESLSWQLNQGRQHGDISFELY